MKTAMQELLEHLVNEWSSPSDCWNPSKVIDKVESMIEKEKEQIVQAFKTGYNVTDYDADDYFDLLYNQNK